MLLRDVIMTSYCCQRHTECLITTFFPAGQCTDTPRHTHATVELLYQQTSNFLVPNLWPPNSPGLSPVDYEIWAVMQHRVYHRQIRSVDELKRQLINVWCSLNSQFLTRLLTSGRKTSSMCPCYRRTFRVQPVNWQC